MILESNSALQRTTPRIKRQSDRVEEEFEQGSQAQGTILGAPCVGPGVGLHDPCGFFPTQDIL